jgi:hypothetical protein
MSVRAIVVSYSDKCLHSAKGSIEARMSDASFPLKTSIVASGDSVGVACMVRYRCISCSKRKMFRRP